MTKVKIMYEGVHVGWRLYTHNGTHFVGYQWIDDAYAYYEMFVASRKLI